MKKFVCLIIAICLIATTEYFPCLQSFAMDNMNTPVISMELGLYKDESKRDYLSSETIRQGRGKTSAKAGERVTLTFILSGVESLDYFQISGSYNEFLLSPGYFSGSGNSAAWYPGEEEQDFQTVIDGCDGMDYSFSFTRADIFPTIYLCSYTTGDAVTVPEYTAFDNGYTVKGLPVITVGFEVVRDIDNIYDAFSWDSEATMISAAGSDYYYGDNLDIACVHQYETSFVSSTCDSDGYSSYHCSYCTEEYRYDYVAPVGHLWRAAEYAAGEFHYFCRDCDEESYASVPDLKLLWSVPFINKEPARTTVDNSSYLDINNDNIINAKDFAIINKK